MTYATNLIRLIRYKNILFILLIQKLLEYAIMTPILASFGFREIDTRGAFWLLNLSTIFLAAGGYIINDYFDVKIDEINRPQQVIIDNGISRRQALRWYQTFSSIGFAIGVILSFWVNSLTLGFIIASIAGLLWFYAASYKRQFLVGNIIVSLISGLSLLVVAILCMALLEQSYSNLLLLQTPIPLKIYAWIGGFSSFAFLLTWIREIIKDIEDIEGDQEAECRTMPIVWGVRKSKMTILTLILLVISLLLFLYSRYIDFGKDTTIIYMLFAIIIPLLILSILVIKADKKNDFSQCSTLSKIIMVMGIAYSIIFYYYQAKIYHLSFMGLFWIL